ncbi:hypothetical protein [Methylobacterium radiodurans]|uniref:Uncharacterized protein n=1 Tax=Methylobacterium radiodurans TaxID=2202828 RepID=A0A2U8VWY1_9HYPH|nr:hypothetical protein [Methylobacterium radiodurans]AWN37752.1 hypothetical protein DK427_20145 [Methylobacterium radiodurans]
MSISPRASLPVPHDVGHEVLAAWRTTQSTAPRSAYANASDRTKEELRDLLKARLAYSPSQPYAVDA